MSESPRPLTFMGIDVMFPYKDPYQAQRSIIAKAMCSFVQHENALLESPTGTGKSLALLASSLAYQDHISSKGSTPPVIVDPNPKADPPPETSSEHTQNGIKIFYTSRTHSQLKQLVSELKRLPYRPRECILASRQQLCLNQQVIASGDIEKNCRIVHLKRHSCPYGKNGGTVPGPFLLGGEHEKYDLEDLIDFCRETTRCPYLVTRQMLSVANFVLCPYNYITDTQIREQMKINLASSIVIFDEAHNLESVCRDSAGLSATHLEVEGAFRFFDENVSNEARQLLVGADTWNALQHLRSIFSNIKIWFERKEAETDRKSNYITEKDFDMVLGGWGISAITWSAVDADFFILLKAADSGNPNEDDKVIPDYIEVFLRKFHNTLGLIFSNGQCNSNDFRLLIKFNQKKEDNALTILCMNPAVVFKPIAESTHSIVLSSGTLSPLEQFSGELGVEFKHTLSALHVIQPSQVRAFLVSSSNGKVITSAHSSLKDETKADAIFCEIGNLLKGLLPSIPDGVLFFMQSYSSIQKMSNIWKQKGIFEDLGKLKPIFVESQTSRKGKDMISEYKASIDRGDGGLLIGVCRGRMSEGIDFSDAQARAVFIFGIPYPNFTDADVKLKREYNDGMSKSKKLPTGDEWYEAQAYRSLFQAIGRCIRHINDYGAIVLLDERFCRIKSRFPRWINQSFSAASKTSDIDRELRDFYSDMVKKFPDSARPSSINPKNGVKVTCAHCTKEIFDLRTLNIDGAKICESRGFSKKVAADNAMIEVVKQSQRASCKCEIDESEWLSEEGIVLGKLVCPGCKTIVGAKVVAADFPHFGCFEESWLIVSKCFVSQNELSVPMGEIVNCPKILSLGPSSSDGQTQLVFSKI